MAKLMRVRGTTSNIVRVFIQDNSVTTGVGKTGLTNSSTNLQISVIREKSSTVTIYTGANIETITTIGTFANPTTSAKCGFKAVDGTNMPGVYEIHFHDSANHFGTGDTSKFVNVLVMEITTTALNIAPVPTEIQLTSFDNDTAIAQTGDAYTIVNNGTYGNSALSGRIPTALTGNGNMKSSLMEVITTTLTETVGGQISAAFKQFFDVGTPTGTMKAITNVVTSTNLTNAPTAGDFTAAMKTSIANTVWDEVLTGATHNVTNSAGKRLRLLGAQAIGSGTLPSQVGMAVNAITLDAGASATLHLYVECLLVIDTGTAIGEAHHILSYNGTTKVAIIDDDWITQPAAGDTYQIYGASAFDAVTGLASAGGANTITLAATQTSAVTDYYINQSIYIASGTGAGQRRRINAYNGTTKVATVSSNWATNPDTTSAYMIYEGNQVYVDVNNDKTGYALTQAFPTNFAALSITAGGLIDITQAAADKVWSTAARLLTAGTNIALTKGVGLLGLNDITAADVWAAGARTLTSFGTLVSDIWSSATAGMVTVGSIGKKLADWVLGTDNKVLLSNNAQTGVTIPTVTTLTNTPSGIRIQKNAALNNFMFLMVSSTDHATPKTLLAVTATRSIDGAVFAACANAVTEVANGMYKINLAATDLNGDVIAFKFTGGATADDRLITIVTTA